jgi:hypothetical protein
MAELADAADLKSAGLKRLVGVRVPLSAPLTNELSNRITASRLEFWLALSAGYADTVFEKH